MLYDDHDKSALRELVRLIASRRAIAIVGAGVSSRLGYPGWSRLLDLLAGEATKRGLVVKAGDDLELRVDDIKRLKPLLSAQFFKQGLGPAYFDILRRTFGPQKYDEEAIRRDEALRMLVRLPISHFITTNYDPSLETAHRIEKRDVRSITGYGADLQALLAHIDDHDYPRHIFHAHGTYDRPEEIVLAEEDYIRVYTRELLNTALWDVGRMRRFVFLGFSLEDLDVMRRIQDARRLLNLDGHRHFAVLDWDSSKTGAILQRVALRATYGIEPIFYLRDGADYSGYDETLELITAGVRETAPLAEVVPMIVEAAEIPAADRDAEKLSGLTTENLSRRKAGDLQ